VNFSLFYGEKETKTSFYSGKTSFFAEILLTILLET